MSYERVHYESRICVVCGARFTPGRKTQVTCASEECKQKRRKGQRANWYKENFTRVAQAKREEREKARFEAATKPDTIVAIGYAERQIAASLEKAGKIRTEL